MKNHAVKFAAIVSLALASSAMAGLSGDTYNFGVTQTGTVTITGQSGPGPYTAPGTAAGFCVGPNSNNCATSGLSASVTISNTQVTFNFSGSTNSSNGTFVVNLTNFLPANITNVTYVSGALGGGTFGLTSFNGSSITFTGTSSGGFSALGGQSIIFNVATIPPPVITKNFGSPVIGAGQTTSLNFSISNPNAAIVLNGIGFTDTLPAGMVVATPNGLTGTCDGGTITATAGSNTVSLSGATLATVGSCAFSVTVTAAAAATYTNSVTVTSTNAGPGNTATATLVVALPASISKSFSPAKIVPGGTSTLTVTVTNPNAVPVPGLAFTDTLPAGVTTASPSNLTNTCGGVAVAVAGSLSLTGGSLAGSSSCTVTVSVTSTEGIKVNNVTITSDFGTGNTATATLTVATPPALTKSFGEVSIGPGNSVALTFTLTNPNTIVTLNALAFTDTLPTGLSVSTPSVVTGVCDSGTIVAVAGTNSIGLSGASLAPGVSCTFKVNVTANGAALSTLTNTTGTVTSTEATAGAAATANIFVGDPFQVSYASNLSVGDSYLDVTNSGALGASLQSGTTASITGALCANVYAFTPDEQLVSCCSCPVTPNGLISFSAKNDLASNTLTPAVPTALVIKLVASVPVAGSCNNSAAAVTAASLANGMKSFETTLHATPVAGSYGVTETPFSSASLSAGELGRITNLCNFILANGSGFGVCRSCRLGGLGAERQ